MNKKLGSTAEEEIRKAMTGLVGAPAKAEATRLAEIHGVSIATIYDKSKGVRHTEGKARKKRSDAGSRTFDINDKTSDLWYAVQLVVVDKLDPDQALLTARTRGRTNLPSLETFRKLLHENGLGKTQRRTARRGHRRWEAEFPGQIFQIDVTALKERWRDETSRRVLKIAGIDKNHPQLDVTKQRVWQIMLVDDHSRRRFLRYVVANAITSTDMVRFECEAFTKLGVPHQLYTDNGSEFKGQHIQAARILGSLLVNEGGYEHVRHAPHNPQATGKVEGAHKWAEKADRYIGLAVSEGRRVTLDDLNRFADDICEYYNHRVHRGTGVSPMVRWHGKRVVVRKIDPSVIESALLSQELPAIIEATLTVTHRKISYRLPNARPFIDFVGKEVKIVVPPSIPMLLVTMPNGDQYEVDKILASVDKAGEFKTIVESTAERITREAKADRKLDIAAIKEQSRLTGEIAPVPHLDITVEPEKGGLINFPQREFVVAAEAVNEVIPVPTPAEDGDATRRERASSPATPAYIGRPVGYWEAVAEFADRFDSKDAGKAFLTTLFEGRTDVPVTELESAIESHLNPQKEVASIRLAS